MFNERAHFWWILGTRPRKISVTSSPTTPWLFARKTRACAQTKLRESVRSGGGGSESLVKREADRPPQMLVARKRWQKKCEFKSFMADI